MSWPSIVEDSSIVSPTAVEDGAWLEEEPQLSWLIQNMDDQPLLVNSGNPLTQKDIAITTRSQLNACSMMYRRICWKNTEMGSLCGMLGL
jgi:hypothetical protein